MAGWPRRDAWGSMVEGLVNNSEICSPDLIHIHLQATARWENLHIVGLGPERLNSRPTFLDIKFEACATPSGSFLAGDAQNCADMALKPGSVLGDVLLAREESLLTSRSVKFERESAIAPRVRSVRAAIDDAAGKPVEAGGYTAAFGTPHHLECGWIQILGPVLPFRSPSSRDRRAHP